jgi:2-hydroxychromene-2-carboxylate isomerase
MDSGTSTIDFWFDFASGYSYLAAERIEDAARSAGVPFRWKPFLLGPIFQKQGWTDSPFNLFPAKGRYMWHDIERSCATYGLSFHRPSVFPRNSVLPARVAIVAADQGWCGPFARAVFRANFAEDRDISDPGELVAILDGLGHPGREILGQSESAENKPRLRAQTENAEKQGIFGAPSFVVGGELFWGNDRLEQSIAWARSGGREDELL